MATNYIQAGQNWTVAAPSALTSGDGVLIGGLFGVAQNDAASGADVTLGTCGVYSLPRETGTSTAWSVGDVVYWDDGNSRCTKTASENYRIGVAFRAAADGATTGEVRLDGISAVQEPT